VSPSGSRPAGHPDDNNDHSQTIHPLGQTMTGRRFAREGFLVRFPAWRSGARPGGLIEKPFRQPAGDQLQKSGPLMAHLMVSDFRGIPGESGIPVAVRENVQIYINII